MGKFSCRLCGFETSNLTTFSVHACAESRPIRCFKCGKRASTRAEAEVCSTSHKRGQIAVAWRDGEEYPSTVYMFVGDITLTYALVSTETDEQGD